MIRARVRESSLIRRDERCRRVYSSPMEDFVVDVSSGKKGSRRLQNEKVTHSRVGRRKDKKGAEKRKGGEGGRRNTFGTPEFRKRQQPKAVATACLIPVVSRKKEGTMTAETGAEQCESSLLPEKPTLRHDGTSCWKLSAHRNRSWWGPCPFLAGGEAGTVRELAARGLAPSGILFLPRPSPFLWYQSNQPLKVFGRR